MVGLFGDIFGSKETTRRPRPAALQSSLVSPPFLKNMHFPPFFDQFSTSLTMTPEHKSTRPVSLSLLSRCRLLPPPTCTHATHHVVPYFVLHHFRIWLFSTSHLPILPTLSLPPSLSPLLGPSPGTHRTPGRASARDLELLHVLDIHLILRLLVRNLLRLPPPLPPSLPTSRIPQHQRVAAGEVALGRPNLVGEGEAVVAAVAALAPRLRRIPAQPTHPHMLPPPHRPSLPRSLPPGLPCLGRGGGQDGGLTDLVGGDVALEGVRLVEREVVAKHSVPVEDPGAVHEPVVEVHA